MSFYVVVQPEAETDLAAAFDWYEDKKPGLGEDFLREIKRVFERLAENPLACHILHRDVRRALVRRFPYKVIYLVESDRIEVIGVIHVKRHPDYWKGRLQ